MANRGNGYIWLDGRFIRWEDAKVHLLTHSLQYGSGIFEGIRCYSTARGPAIFRLHEHITRFMESMKIYCVPVKATQRQIEQATIQIIRKNKMPDAYIRPFAFYNGVGIGFSTAGLGASVSIMAVRFGNLFQGHQNGLRCKTSTWHRINSGILPAGAKASGNYPNSILASKEAKDAGYDEAILMSDSGMVAEGPGENIFIVKDDVLVTPPRSANILMGITRDSIIRIAQSSGVRVEERDIRKEELYTSDEVFFSGTAAEITPIISVDSRSVGGAKPGPITLSLAAKYSSIAHGESKEFGGWLTYV